MALGLNRIWVRFGLWITAAVLLAIASLAIGVLAFSELQYREFYRHLPSPVRTELEALKSQDLEDSPRALQIYSEYWEGDRLFGEKWSLVIGLAVSLPFGMAVGFWISRRITSPLASMVEVAARVERGDLAARAVKGTAHGEMAEMIDAFNGMVDSLENLEAERLATAASISHELRTPLTVLQARLHAICDGVIDSDQAEMKTLLAQVEHLGRLVGDLHTLSMADAGQLSLRRERLDLATLVGEVVDELRPQLQQSAMAAEQLLVAGFNQSEQALVASQETGRRFASIAERLGLVSELGNQIAQSMEEQSEVTESIHHNVLTIRELASDSTDSSKKAALHILGLSGRLSAMNKLVMQFQHAARSSRTRSELVVPSRLRTTAAES